MSSADLLGHRGRVALVALALAVSTARAADAASSAAGPQAPAPLAGTATPSAPADDREVGVDEGILLTPMEPPLRWVRYLGVSRTGQRVAYRAGADDRRNRVGAPLDIVRVEGNQVRDRLHVEHNVAAALRERSIFDRGALAQERATPQDVLIRHPNGTLFAAVVREQPRVLALLRRDASGRYRRVAQLPLPRAPAVLNVIAHASPDGRFLILEAHFGAAQRRQGLLWMVEARAGEGR